MNSDGSYAGRGSVDYIPLSRDGAVPVDAAGRRLGLHVTDRSSDQPEHRLPRVEATPFAPPASATRDCTTPVTPPRPPVWSSACLSAPSCPSWAGPIRQWLCDINMSQGTLDPKSRNKSVDSFGDPTEAMTSAAADARQERAVQSKA